MIITVDNSYSHISDLTVSQEKELKTLLSYNVGSQAAFFAGSRGQRRSLIDRRGSFPSGLLPKVKAFAKNATIVDKRVKPKAVGHGGLWASIMPYAEQMKAVKAATLSGRGIISSPTGTGKSLIIALIASHYGLKTLVVVPSLEIKKQLTGAIDSFLGPRHLVDVENIDSKSLQTPSGYDVLILDEAHHAAAKTYRQLNKTAWSGIYYRFYLTATPFRSQAEESIIFESIAGQVIYELTYASAVAQGLIVPVEAYYIEVPKVKNDYYAWAEVYYNLVVHNEMRNEMIALTLARLNAADLSTLCLVKEVAHGAKIEALTGLAFANGKDDNTRAYITDFNSVKIRSLIGTEGILGEGVDTKPCEYVIIAGLGKAKGAFMQKVGRAVRIYPGKDSAKVIIIKDLSHKFTARHFREQCKILKEYYGITPTKLEL